MVDRRKLQTRQAFVPWWLVAQGLGAAMEAGGDLFGVTWDMLKTAADASLKASLGVPLALGAVSGAALSKATEPSMVDLKNQQRRLINARLSTMLGENLRKKYRKDKTLAEQEEEKKKREAGA